MKSVLRGEFWLALVLLCCWGLGCKKLQPAKPADDKPISTQTTPDSTAKPTEKAKSDMSAPANVEGTYTVAGTNPNGSKYEGELNIIKRDEVYQFRWKAGTPYDGVGITNGDTIAVSFANGADGTGCGVVSYKIQPDGTLDGQWGYWGVNMKGTETATRTAGTGLAGEYTTAGHRTDGKEYNGKLTVKASGTGFSFTWDDNSNGFGIRQGDTVAVGIGGQGCGFVAYQIGADGTLDGQWGGYGNDKTGTEKAIKRK